MKKLSIALVAMVLNSAAMAAPSTFAELGLIVGGENGGNAENSEVGGLEIAGSFAFNEVWYAGGVIGGFESDPFGNNTKTENDYININGGAVTALSERTDRIT